MSEQTCCDKNIGEQFTCGQLRIEIDRLKAELESKDKAIKLLQGHCNALMDTEGKLAQWKKGHTAGQEAAGYYQKQADDMIRQLRKELSDENANFTEEIMNLERQLSEARAELERFKHMAEQNSTEMCEWMEKANKARKDAARECMQICDDLDAEGYYYEINNHAIVKDRIAAKFGLEG